MVGGNDPYYGWFGRGHGVGPSWFVFAKAAATAVGRRCHRARFWGNGELVIGVVPNDWFVFVGERHFGEHIDRRGVIINNMTIINRTGSTPGSRE